MKYVLLTGASGGLGYELSKYLLENGYYVIMLYHNHKDRIEELHRKYKNGMLYKIDLTNDDEIDALVKYLYDYDIKIDILINNAAIDHTSKLIDKTKQSFMGVLELNTYVPFKLMKDIEYKTCVNISSENAIDTYDEVSLEYDVSKVGLNMLSSIFRTIHPDRIYNTICFGWLDTPMNKELTDDIKKYIEFVPFDKAVKEIVSLFDKQQDMKIVRK
jgi:NAD(P)-dependent dehydrogenase (short-subunit alcohol dehydrogenase family)